MFIGSALTTGRSLRLLAVIALAFSCLSVSILAQATATVRVGTQFTVGMGEYADIAVTLENPSSGFAMGGFDFLLSYNAHAISLVSVEPGQILNDCGWEYFNFQAGPSPICTDSLCTDEVVRIVVVAETNNGPIHPTCFGETPGTLINLRFRTSFNMQYEYLFSPISWVWQDCGDNAISSITGDSLLISNDVFDFNGTSMTQNQPFPTLTGANSTCDGNGLRLIDFHGGGIETGVGWPGWSDYRGDVDFNGAAFEAGDYYFYATYFLYGFSVFTIDAEGQVSASDANYDGLTLTIADLIYLYRVHIGDLSLYTKRSVNDTVYLFQDTVQNTISVNYPDSLSGFFLIFGDSIQPETNLLTHSVLSDSITSNSRVMVIPSTSYNSGLPTIPSGELLSYSGEGLLTSAWAFYDGVSEIPVIFEIGDNGCCRNRGNTNGSDDGSIDIADVTFYVSYLFGNAPAPPCPEEGDVDGSGAMDVSDLTHLVNYLFRGGPPPPGC